MILVTFAWWTFCFVFDFARFSLLLVKTHKGWKRMLILIWQYKTCIGQFSQISILLNFCVFDVVPECCQSTLFQISFLLSVYIRFCVPLAFFFSFFTLFIYFSVCLLHFSFIFSLCLWIFLCASCILHFVMCSQPLGCQMLSSAKCYTLAGRQPPVVPTEFWLLQTPTAHALSCRWKLWNCRRVG